MTDDEIRYGAIEFARKNRLAVARELTDPKIYAPSRFPISVFMAGSPGAGKTEFSRNLLLEILEDEGKRRVVVIDSDEIRPRIPGYTGSNSYLFQGATSLIVEKMQDLVLHRGQHFIFDGTFSYYPKAVENINRSLLKKRFVFIFYLFQKPEIAWEFTVAREKREGRNIPKEVFISQFLSARETVSRIRREFGDGVHIFLVKKDFEKNLVENITEIKPGDKTIDDYLKISYNKEELENLL